MSLHLYVGPMFAGKTHELMRQARRFVTMNMKVLIVNHSSDVRVEGGAIRSHDGQQVPATKVERLAEVSEAAIKEARLVCVDEGQFFPDLQPTVLRWVNEFGKEVHVSGLDGDYRQQPIGDMLSLIPQCDTVTKLHALCVECQDGTPAPFTCRHTAEGAEVYKVGAAETYKSLCRRHMLQRA